MNKESELQLQSMSQVLSTYANKNITLELENERLKIEIQQLENKINELEKEEEDGD